ncbi:MAG TPA: thioredoxin family protein [Pseudolabrys sp.]|nr:thioredoxin family protein [Pseudolabrys sp.]
MQRRDVILGMGAAALGALAGPPARAQTPSAAPMLTDDGLYKEPWFVESFLDLPDDLEGARKENKRFVVMWELKGCPYCKETHFVNFAQPRITDFVRANFQVLQLNIIGSRKVTDFDGTELSEKRLAAKYGVIYTPTFQFFGERADALKGAPPEKREVARIQGYLRPDDFLAMFRYVQEKAYENKSFRDYVKAMQS